MPAGSDEKTRTNVLVFVCFFSFCGIMYAGEPFLSPLRFASHHLRLGDTLDRIRYQDSQLSSHLIFWFLTCPGLVWPAMSI